jgi:hypothetical protein
VSSTVTRRSLDDFSRPYERLLLCERLVRGALTLTVAQMLWNVPDAIHESWTHDASAAEWLMMGAAWLFVTAVGAFAMWIIVAMLRGFFRGSLKSAAGWLIFSLIVIPWGMYGWYLEAAATQVRNGTIWVFLVARLEPASIFVFAAIAGWTLLRHPDVRRLRADLPGRISVWQSCGVIRPLRRRWRMVTDTPFLLSMVALILDGTAFYPLSEVAGFLRRTPDAFAAYVPAGAAAIEAHYLYLTGLSLFIAPVLFLWFRGAFALGEKVRRLARRAAVLSAQRALELDARAPVLFLRSFVDDHVSLSALAEPRLVSLFDPERERMDLEDLLQTCLSLGPLVAIGRPDDGRAPIGIPRAYVGADWRASVGTFMDIASLIVLAVSDSRGIAWELDQLSRPEHRERAVIVTPPGHSRHYALLTSALSKFVGDRVNAARCLAEVAADHDCVVGLLPGEANDTTVLTTRGIPSRAHYDIVLLMALQRASVRRGNLREKTAPRPENVSPPQIEPYRTSTGSELGPCLHRDRGLAARVTAGFQTDPLRNRGDVRRTRICKWTAPS